MLGLENVEQTANGQRKVGALERWLKALGPDYAKKLLHCSKPDYQGDWEQLDAWSEFGDALRKKPWLRTSKGHVAPPTAYLDAPEFREFFGDFVAYVAADIATPLPATPVPYAELHAHSSFSFLDGASMPENLAEEAARLGLTALALFRRDHRGR